jgi:hypothetical protein
MSRPVPADDVASWIEGWTGRAAAVVVPMQRAVRFAH